MNQMIRTKIASRINKQVAGKVYLASWDDKRLGFESTSLVDIYWSDVNKFQEILDNACEGTGYFIEMINSCEAHICTKVMY